MKFTTPLLSGAFLVVLGGCTSLTPYFDQQVGTAVETAKAQQTLNPDASRNTDPVEGIDGTAATLTVDEYHNSFKTPPPTFPVINVGGSGR